MKKKVGQPQVKLTKNPNDRDPHTKKQPIADTNGRDASKKKGLRATIPKGIGVFLGLNKGDKLEWKIKIIDGEKFAIVKKLQEPK